MPSCFVCGRTRNKNSTIEDITFHKFPVNEKVRDKWKNFVLENKLNILHSINKYSVVCSKHFLETCFVMRNNKRFLVGNAVPSKIILRVKSARNLYSEEVKLLNQPIVCSDNEPKSSFKVTQTLIKVPDYVICNGESVSDFNKSTFSNTNTSVSAKEHEDQVVGFTI
ncbi:unnamed protein product [Macrosiphum euphorbiae]|uniref:THAP-type domain-containing protein n=1 Tax=Macrosiphum euphorbiae TaxID=13131 RepID=A0AAV0Y4G0_9HEMI|nr:unnamed protein product [Macrosiphum euphorbiae]